MAFFDLAPQWQDKSAQGNVWVSRGVFSISPQRGTINQPRATPWVDHINTPFLFSPAPKGHDKSAQGNALG